MSCDFCEISTCINSIICITCTRELESDQWYRCDLIITFIVIIVIIVILIMIIIIIISFEMFALFDQ